MLPEDFHLFVTACSDSVHNPHNQSLPHWYAHWCKHVVLVTIILRPDHFVSNTFDKRSKYFELKL